MAKVTPESVRPLKRFSASLISVVLFERGSVPEIVLLSVCGDLEACWLNPQTLLGDQLYKCKCDDTATKTQCIS